MDQEKFHGTYADLETGQWVSPIRLNYRLACCDCGLVHKIDFRFKDKTIQFRLFRDGVATAARRRFIMQRRKTNRKRK